MRSLSRSLIPSLLISALTSTTASVGQPGPPPGPAGPPPGPAAPTPQPAPQPAYGGQAPAPTEYPAPGGYGVQPGYNPSGSPAPAQPQTMVPGQPAYGQPADPAPQQPSPGTGFEGQTQFGTNGIEAGVAGPAVPEDSEESSSKSPDYRALSLTRHNGLEASTGLWRVRAADSGAPGTFRFSLSSAYYAGSSFLCPQCETTSGTPNVIDEVERVGAHIQISATPASFLEAHIGFHSSATSNDLGLPTLLQVLGDANIGLKGFMPHEPDQLFTAGGGVDLVLLNGTGSVGVGNANFRMNALATADFSNKRQESERVPLRAHLNMGYYFDNSANLVEDVETARGGSRITRIERFGLGINRVDRFEIGLGLEGVFEYVRPFAEWTIGIPSNRQGYACDRLDTNLGDRCLGDESNFGHTPSRFTLGGRVLPPFLEGLSGLLALDIGTGATSQFVEEVAPEVPWNLHMGIGYAVDIQPRVQIKELPPEAPVATETVRYFIEGSVVEKGTVIAVAGAILRYDGNELTGMVANTHGHFRSAALEPGNYTLSVDKDGYHTGSCVAAVGPQPPYVPTGYGQAPIVPGQAAPGYGGAYGQASAYNGQPYGAQPQRGQPGTAPLAQPAYGQPGAMGPNPMGPAYPGGPVPADGAGYGSPPPAPELTGPQITSIRCELQALPQVGHIDGVVTDAESNDPVAGVGIKITDKRDRSLDIVADQSGTFRFENIPPGTVTLAVEADGYLRTVIQVDVAARKEQRVSIPMAKRPARSNVVVTTKEIRLKKQVHFAHSSAELMPDSIAIIAEIAEVMSDHSEIERIEVQGHTDNTGSPAYNMKLSADRAAAVREALIVNGVALGRITAKGYGDTQPLAPNVSDRNRSRNRRVQLVIKRRR
ncbi:MAG: OmpA family protein [Polyangiaceae bacterium]|nr:OmpA family protein [Polyangiaceae bacterium]